MAQLVPEAEQLERRLQPFGVVHPAQEGRATSECQGYGDRGPGGGGGTLSPPAGKLGIEDLSLLCD